MADPAWEIVALHPTDALDEICGFVASFCGGSHYVPRIIGMDYSYVADGLYRQCLARCVERAAVRRARRVLFGIGAPLEKARFGAARDPRVAYVLGDQSYDDDVVRLLGEGVAAQTARGGKRASVPPASA